ncbi:MAG TPA: ABC transporter ATP-binding protein [Polyangiaceae bacterium]|jgi:oligopeptide transport system ATP-binding protein|nr:ABC transporter ATP-binding protein [Polyangiaceae bacterium]
MATDPSRDPSPSVPLLGVENLTTEFRSEQGTVRAVDHVSFTLERGEMLGIVGESGSGKSATSLSIMGLLPPRGRIVAGSVALAGRDLVALSEAERRALRGRRLAMIFQDPMTALNPYLRIGEQLTEGAIAHLGIGAREAERRAVALLERVRIADARARLRSYPHELSGGMRQRVLIAMALLCDPEVLIADEPTTALDVTVQAQILELLRELMRERRLGVVLISHDLGVVATTCDRVVVMYAGRVVELAPARELFARPLHPYTAALLGSLPRLESTAARRLEAIPGMPPRLDQGPFRECSFAPRCRFVHDSCKVADPPLTEAGPGRLRRCVLPLEKLG